MGNLTNKDVETLKKYVKIYDNKDIIFFSSYLLKKSNSDEIEREKGIMSNLYTGDFKIPYNGIEFNSSEQLLFYLNIIRWAKLVGIDDDKIKFKTDFLLSCNCGGTVKNHPQNRNFYEEIVGKKKKLIGCEKTFIDGWKNQYFILQLKYQYCPEFRNVLIKYKDKMWCENSDKPDCKLSIAGVLLDETSGKYCGINCVGRAMRRVFYENYLLKGEY